MTQRQFRSDDTSAWIDKYGTGSDGGFSLPSGTLGEPAAHTSITTTVSSTAATFGSGTGFANGDLLLIHQSRNGGTGTGKWELNKITSGGGTTSVVLAYSTMNAYDTTAQVYKMKQYSSYNIASGATFIGDGWTGTSGGISGFFSTGPVTIAGTFTMTAKGYRGGAVTAFAQGNQGEGTAGAGGISTAANGTGGGGNSGSNGGSGGGNSAAGSSASGSNGGGVGSSSDLVTADFGGGGGSGDDQSGGSGGNNFGGAGGGFILIIAPSITVTGSLNNDGSNGGQATSGNHGGGGGGAGGATLFKGQTIVVNVTTSAPPGQGGAGRGSGGAGATASYGVIAADYGISFTGSSNPATNSRLDSSFNTTQGGSFLFNMI